MSDAEKDAPVETAAKDAAAIRIFPPAIPLLTVLGGVLLQGLLPVGSDLMPQSPLRYWIGGGIIVAAVYLLGFRAVRAMRRSGQSENPYRKTTEILQCGPYRVTRNPMYLQFVVVCIGFAILLANLWILVLTPLCVAALHVLVILPEERYLAQKFGDTYDAYRRRVRRWI